MKNIDLAKKIKELRTRKGFSQDELAETAQINLRTVQRIEGGETEPRGDTLKRLANALTVTPDELIDWAEQEDKGVLILLNLSALSFIAFPILGIIVPLALWFLKKDKIKNLSEMGKRLLNFQISWCMLIFLCYGLTVAGLIFGIKVVSFSILGYSDLEIFIFMIPVLYIANGIFVIINTYRSYKGKTVFYKPAIRFLR
ncbi:helix-turn-helix domain-containing protein [Mucilaginibacter sp. BJC16-A38]|uniref:helix-turn-helix domain-containing protein n=1 Tax=Mucilaginibacter phenanthrenivorans TaxID=1234842 RepID=UPI0021589F63|nr:helix-turn-helix domain-containing protein [Mucilaginibacter phenanthrenivorans]MCR8557773.1 helix-turn-helix domain-containing protein [Mucilaginibacter phenanthrenivorans]